MEGIFAYSASCFETLRPLMESYQYGRVLRAIDDDGEEAT